MSRPDLSPGGENARDPQRSGVSAPDPDATVWVAPDSDSETFHRGLGCASGSVGPVEAISRLKALDRGYHACDNCAPDMASPDPRLGGDD